MNDSREFDGVALSPAEMAAVDDAVARFELALSAGEQPSIEAFLADVSEPAKTVLLDQLIATEIEYRRSKGERVSRQDYESRFPAPGDEDVTLDTEAALAGTHTRTSTFEPAEDKRPRDENPPPQTLGRYEVQKQLGRGAFGVVYLAWDPQLKRQVAIKVPRLRTDDHEQQIESFIAEAQRAVQLERHAGIVPVYDVGREGDLCYIVSQFVDGGTLSQLVAKKQLSLPHSLELVAKLAETIQFAHDQGWMHRDIKPSNVLIDADGKTYLTDFGLTARLDEVGAAGTKAQGTPNYMAPELVQGVVARMQGKDDDAVDSDHRVDVYSLGVVLYELLAGRLPFDADNLKTLFDSVLNDKARPLRETNPEMPPSLEEICLRALAKDPDQRFQSAGELAAQLRAIAGALNTESKTPAAQAHPRLTPARIATLVGAIVLIAIVGVIVFFASQSGNGNSNPVAPEGGDDQQIVASVDEELNNDAQTKRLETVDKLRGLVAADVQPQQRRLGEPKMLRANPAFGGPNDPPSPDPPVGAQADLEPKNELSEIEAAKLAGNVGQEFRLLLKATGDLNREARFSESEKLAQRMVELSVEDEQQVPLAYGQLGRAQLGMGFTDEAAQTLNFALNRAKKQDDEQEACELLISLGTVQMQEKDYPAATESYRQAADLLTDAAPYDTRARLLRNQIVLHIETDRLDDAESPADQLRDIARDDDELSQQVLKLFSALSARDELRN